MLREIELAFARREHMTLTSDGRVMLNLPVSKTDPRALGCTRVWGCVCAGAGSPDSCIFHAAQDHQTYLDGRFGDEDESPGLPLFPNFFGHTVSKHAVVETIESVAELMGLSVLGKSGERTFGGHTIRVSGARWLARSGVSVAQIQTFGRWASAAVLRYVGEAHIEDLASTVTGVGRKPGADARAASAFFSSSSCA